MVGGATRGQAHGTAALRLAEDDDEAVDPADQVAHEQRLEGHRHAGPDQTRQAGAVVERGRDGQRGQHAHEGLAEARARRIHDVAGVGLVAREVAARVGAMKAVDLGIVAVDLATREVEERDVGMILKVFADPREVEDRRDPVADDLGAGTHTGEHEQLG